MLLPHGTPPLDPWASAVIDHLLVIQDSLREVKRLVEEGAL